VPNTSRADSATPGSNHHDSRALLAAIKQTHQQLISEMANMEALTRETEPDRLRYSHLRWKLSQASLSRRNLCAKICDHLRPAVTKAECETLTTIQDADRELARASAMHIGRWSADSIQTSWSAYCQASGEIRWKMRAYLGMEQRLLFPIIERAARLEI
jgi:hypothetical protein